MPEKINLTSAPAALADLAPLPEGGILSLQLLKSPAGNVTLFGFAQGEELSEHTAPFDALVVMLEGAMTITIGGAPHETRAGRTLLMPANVPHALRAAEPSRMLLIMLKDQKSQ